MRQRSIRTALTAVAVVAGFQASGAAQFGFGPGFADTEIKLVDRFDKDGDGRLNREERAAARKTTASTGGGRFRRGGVNGGGAANAGPRLTPADARPYPTTPLYDLGTLRT